MPVRCAQWSERDGRVVLERPRPVTSGLRGLRDRLSYWMATPRIRLDELGSQVWRRIDGVATVSHIANELRSGLPDNGEQIEERLVLFLRMLANQGAVELLSRTG